MTDEERYQAFESSIQTLRSLLPEGLDLLIAPLSGAADEPAVRVEINAAGQVEELEYPSVVKGEDGVLCLHWLRLFGRDG